MKREKLEEFCCEEFSDNGRTFTPTKPKEGFYRELLGRDKKK